MTEKQVLECIEFLAGEAGLPNKLSEEGLRNTLEDIYRFAHVGVGRCDADHKDWQKELERYYEDMKK